MEALKSSGLPIDFIFSIRIALESTKISRVIDLKMSTNSSSDRSACHLGLIRLFESDLDASVDSMMTREVQSGNRVEYSLLMAKLNLYSFGLNQATKLRAPEATDLRMSAFDCATRLIHLITTEPFIPAHPDGPLDCSSLPVQRYYPFIYSKYLGYACLLLLKLRVTESLPERETSQSETAIHEALDLLNACSMVQGDEFDVIARMVRLLGQEAVQEIVKPRYEVKSRMGASLMYEMIMSALAWRKHKAREQRKGSESQPQDHALIENAPCIDTSPNSDMFPQEVSGLFTGSGHVDGTGPMGFDSNFWDTAVLEQVSLMDESGSCKCSDYGQLLALDDSIVEGGVAQNLSFG